MLRSNPVFGLVIHAKVLVMTVRSFPGSGPKKSWRDDTSFLASFTVIFASGLCAESSAPHSCLQGTLRIALAS